MKNVIATGERPEFFSSLEKASMLKSLVVIVLALTLLLAGCATKPTPRCKALGDTPEQHYLAGMEALEQNRFDVAQGKFERAIYCDEDFSLAYGGLAIVYAHKAALQRDPDFESVERKRAIENVDKAGRTADTPEEKFAHYLSVIRVNIHMDGKDWVTKTENAHMLARSLTVDEGKLLYYQFAESLDYFMGIAYLRAHEFEKARGMFAGVLKARSQGKWQGYADRAWKKTDRVARAVSGATVGDMGKRIAVQDAITRGDLAILLVQELKVEKLFDRRTDQVGQVQQEFTPSDIAGYPFKEEVVTILKRKVRGIEPKYDEVTKSYLFKPMDTVKRGEMAFVLEDVLIRITGDQKITTAYLGHERSPFPDIKPTSPFYNAVMNVTTRGIMEGEASGEFKVDSPVSGADAILAVRVLKQNIKIQY